jgi:hypothetical protein
VQLGIGGQKMAAIAVAVCAGAARLSSILEDCPCVAFYAF